MWGTMALSKAGEDMHLDLRKGGIKVGAQQVCFQAKFWKVKGALPVSKTTDTKIASCCFWNVTIMSVQVP